MINFDLELENLLMQLSDDAYKNSFQKIQKFHSDQVDLSTNFDEDIEKQLVSFLNAKYPKHNVIGEESSSKLVNSKYTWVIDPIDGTKYFNNEIPLWTSTLALLQNDKPIYGLCYYPSERVLYKAIDGQGFFRNRTKLTEKLLESKTVDKSSIILQVTDIRPEIANIIIELFRRFYRVRVFGSSALALSWLAQGGFDAYVNLTEPHEKIIDSMAGLLFVKESGGQTLRFNNKFGSESYITGRLSIINEIAELISPIIKDQIF